MQRRIGAARPLGRVGHRTQSRALDLVITDPEILMRGAGDFPQPVVVADVGCVGCRLAFAEQLDRRHRRRSEEHTSELQSLMRSSYAVFCLKKKKNKKNTTDTNSQ